MNWQSKSVIQTEKPHVDGDMKDAHIANSGSEILDKWDTCVHRNSQWISVIHNEKPQVHDKMKDGQIDKSGNEILEQNEKPQLE